jgi:spore photoproduct lyase
MLQKTIRKSLEIKPSGRSTDYITPSFIMGCGFNCSYCYCKRHKTEGVDVSKNIDTILSEINSHAWFADVIKPNQTHPEYITYDIG